MAIDKISDILKKTKIFKAMGNPTRFRIMKVLCENKYCVCELTDMAGLDTSTVSKHLSVLENAGLVEGQRKGKEVYYRIKCTQIGELFKCVEKIVNCNNLKTQ